MLKISSGGQILLFKENEIVRFEAKQISSIIHFQNSSTSEIKETIANIEEQLKRSGFIRIHPMHLVNVNHISGIPGDKPGFIEMNKHKLLPISEKQREIIIDLISDHLQSKK